MADDGIGVVALTPDALPTDAPKASLVAEQDDSWYKGEPLWSGQSKDIAARLWMAITKQTMLLHIVVNDPKHENSYHERNLWRGDSIYLSFDARNDTTEEQLKRGEFAPDDATYLFALGSRGPEGYAVKHGNPAEAALGQTKLIRRLVRDEVKQTTTYDIAIPYDKLSTAFGQSNAVGVALCVAHKNQDKQDMNWGRANATSEAPRKLFPVVLDTGKDDFVTIAPRITRLIPGCKFAEVTVAMRSSKGGGATLAWNFGKKSGQMECSGTGRVERFVVRVPSGDVTVGAAELGVRVTPSKTTSDLAGSLTCQLCNPAVIMDRFQGHIGKLLETAGNNEILRDHMDSTLRVVRDAFERLALEKKSHPERIEQFMDLVELIDGKRPAGKFDYEDHVRRGKPFVCAFVSEADRTLQFYALQMPFNFEPSKKYPLTIYLHGMGDPNPLGGLSTAFDNSHQDTLFRNEPIKASDIPPSHRGFVLAPWARGNSFYRGDAELDVWQCMEMVCQRFKIDPDRIYLTGFSMGCSGTMAIAGRQPDIWAGINLSSGFGEWSDTRLDYLMDNLRGLPMALWIGELDPMLEGARSMHQILLDKHIEHRFEVIPQLPHTYPYDEYQKNVGYLMQFTRKRPASFRYVADGNVHSGRNGVFMNIPRGIFSDKLPTFTCSVEGKKVTIDSQNTSGLAVETGTGGLGLAGDIVIIWNGQEAYKGPARRVELGKAPAFPVRR